MQTEYTIYRPDGTEELRSVEMRQDPGYDILAKLIKPIVGGDFERVAIRHEGLSIYTDMFVNDVGALIGLPRNEKATTFYHANMRHGGVLPTANDPQIYGAAVVFHRPVWF